MAYQPTRKSKTVSWYSLVVLLGLAVLASSSSHPAFAADSSPQVTLNVSKATPREVEPLTQNAVLRDYKFAWASLAQALESNSSAAVSGLIVGNANTHLIQRINTQKQTGMTTRYLNQNHKVEAAFYSPEGDILELHDTAEYDLEILDGSKSIHSEHAVIHYVVLMTPGADRWVVRDLQAVSQF